MSNRWMPGLILSLCCAGSLAAQDQAAALMEMEARLDSIQQVGILRDRAYASANTPDTIVAGPLRIATSRGYRVLAQAAAERASLALAAQFGPEVMDRMRIPVLDFGVAGLVVPPDADTAAVARGWERFAVEAIWRQQDTVSGRWLLGSSPGGEFSDDDLRAVTEELIQRPASPNRACLARDPGACAVSLGLRLGADTLAEWYPPETWPRLATLVGGNLTLSEASARQRCMRTGEPEACRIVLTPIRVMPPVGARGREHLMQLALKAGGSGAFERLTAAGALPLEERLAATAGVPLDTLLLRWSDGIRAAPTRGPARPAWELMLAIGWSGLLLVVVLRGARWR